AYYVSNYPNVEAARLGIGLIATVAMDYSPNPLGGAPYTKFYVFNSNGARVNFADLDGRGAKYVPRLCIICHAGQYTPPNNINRDAPLDWAKFTGTSLLSNPSTAGFKQYGPVIEPFVCGIRFMPHAKVPYINFWANSTPASSPNRANELRNAGLDDFAPTLPC